jgi:hypothetical protein
VETPRRADEFVDSIGINAHIDTTVYNEAIIGQSGIRHIRSSVRPFVMPVTYSRLQALYANYGIHINLNCGVTDVTPSQYRDMMKDPMFESIEGLNEPDAVGPRSYAGLTDNWATGNYAATIKFQQDLFDAMTADPVTSTKAVISPAMADPSNSGFLQGIPADFIGMHSYPAQEMPTGNFLTSFAIPGAMRMASPDGPPMRLIATETGYKSGSAWGDISANATRKYVPRLAAEYFRLGMARTFIFELTDTNSVYNYGLLDVNYNPKPAYYALRNLANLVKDSSWNTTSKTWTVPPDYYPSSLDYTLNTASPSVHHVLLQKANGKVYLLLWQEVPSYDLNARQDIANPTVPVDLTFNFGVVAASLYQLDSTTPKANYTNVATLRVNVPDEVVILELTPGVIQQAVSLNPLTSIVTTSANASVSSNQQGKISVKRAGGNTSAALPVYYSVSGTAIAGSDYDSLPGSVTIPAGATEASITINPRNAALVGRKNVVLTLSANSAYDISTTRSATVYLGSSRTVISNFESGTDGWHGNAGASTTWNTSNGDNSVGALQTVLKVNGVDRWINNFEVKFSTAQDWSAVSKLVLRVKEGASNPLSDLGKPVYFVWTNNGVAVGNGYGAAKFPLTLDTTYHTVSLDLGNFPRDRVTSLFFYVDGATLQPADHFLYFDNVTAITESPGLLDDFEEWGVANWTHGGQSNLQVETANADTGVQAMKWTFTNVPGIRWDNHILLNFPFPLDLSQYSTIRLRFKEDGANTPADIGWPVYFDWINNGVRANGAAGVTSFPLNAPSGYRTIELKISEFKRDNVNSLLFYIDGYYMAAGQHVWYIDNITVY